MTVEEYLGARYGVHGGTWSQAEQEVEVSAGRRTYGTPIFFIEQRSPLRASSPKTVCDG